MSILAKFHVRSSRNARDICGILIFSDPLQMENLYFPNSEEGSVECE